MSRAEGRTVVAKERADVDFKEDAAGEGGAQCRDVESERHLLSERERHEVRLEGTACVGERALGRRKHREDVRPVADAVLRVN